VAKKTKKAKKSKTVTHRETLLILKDDVAFSGTEGCIRQWHDVTDSDFDLLENGCLPDTSPDVEISIKTLLTEAKAAGLPCVKNLVY
jgi:hypothetical protein